MNNKLKKIFIFIVLGTVSFIKISGILGSTKFFFSGVNFFIPLLGAFFGGFASSLFIINFFVYKFIFGKSMFTFGIPTLFASLVWAFSLKNKKENLTRILNFLLSVFLPLLCMFLFILHPVGKLAFVYSFYWFIPVILYFIQKYRKTDSIFIISLTSSFVAHAIGSVIWLYILPTTQYYWILLIPCVAVERLVFSCGMAFSYLFIKKFINYKYPDKNFIYEPKPTNSAI
ncbi:hypothetical protein KAT08_01965 [Candidatus Babeliales bacterium]|nr:hypothetical protein [Candidatus Babeliales bacterium]